MAGKTFHGVGFDGETPSVVPNDAPASEDASGEQYSGPTVVDEAKIEESLKRLRSLDQPPAIPIGEVSVSVVDAGSAEPTRIDDRPFVAPAKAPPLVSPGAAISRPTAVGHSVGPSVISQQNAPQLDPLRGTMFGHSIHLPDVATPESAPEELSSGALVVIPRPTAEEMQPFLPDRTTRPAQQHPQFAGVAQPLRRADSVPRARHPHRGGQRFPPAHPGTNRPRGRRRRGGGRYDVRLDLLPRRWWRQRVAAPSPRAGRGTADARRRGTAPHAPRGRGCRPHVAHAAPAAGACERSAGSRARRRPYRDRRAPRPRASAEDGTSKRSSRRDRPAGPASDDRALMPVAPVEAKAAEPAEAKAEPKAVEPKATEALEPKAVELKAEPKAMEPKATEPKTKTGKKKKVELEEDPDATLPPSD